MQLSTIVRCTIIYITLLLVIMDIKKKFGEKLKKLRLERGLSQEGLANEANLDRTYIPGIEKGERNVSITVIEKLAIALKVEIRDFFS